MKTPSIFDYSVISEMAGLDALKQDVQSWYGQEYETGQSVLPQALLLYGPPGTGKTSAAHLEQNRWWHRRPLDSPVLQAQRPRHLQRW